MKATKPGSPLSFNYSARRLALLLGLLGTSLAAQAQTQTALAANRWGVEEGTRIYLDGQASTRAVIDQLDTEAIASVESMLVRDTTTHAAQAKLRGGYLVLITKRNADSPATLALADKMHLMWAHTSRPAPISAVAPPALAYITSHYPKAWLGGEILEMTRKSTGAVTYRVQLADNWGWRYVSFTAAGDFVSDQMY